MLTRHRKLTMSVIDKVQIENFKKVDIRPPKCMLHLPMGLVVMRRLDM